MWQVSVPSSGTQTMRETTQLMRLTNAALIPAAMSTICAVVYSCSKYPDGRRTWAPHGALLEIIWSAAPAALLASMCATSLRVLKYQLHTTDKPFTTVKVVAHQWHWQYEFNIKGRRLVYNSNMLPDDRRAALTKTNLMKYPKLLATDYELVLPERRVVRLLITSSDVIHSFCVPAFGVKVDAIPGKVNIA